MRGSSTKKKFCMVCLNANMECRLYPVKKYNLDLEFTKLTGISLQGIMPFEPQLCAECAQRLSNCSKFRDQSLRAYQLLIELVDNHRILTTQIIKVLDRKTHKLASKISKKVFQPNHCDVRVINLKDNYDAEKNVFEDTDLAIDVKREVEIFDNGVIDIPMNETCNEWQEDVDSVLDIKFEVENFNNDAYDDVIDISVNETESELQVDTDTVLDTKREVENFNNDAYDDVIDISVNETESELQEDTDTVLDTKREVENFNNDAYDDVIDISVNESNRELQSKRNDCESDADSLDFDIDIDDCDDTDYIHCDVDETRTKNKLTNEAHTKENLVEMHVREKTVSRRLDDYIDIDDFEETDNIHCDIDETRTKNKLTNEVHTKENLVEMHVRGKTVVRSLDDYINIDDFEETDNVDETKTKKNFTNEVHTKEKVVKKRIRKRKGLPTGQKSRKLNLKLFQETQLTKEQQVAEILNRKKSNNYKNATHKCSVCFKGYMDLEVYMSHMDGHSENFGALECAVCRLRFKTRQSLIKHIGRNHRFKYKCTICQYTSTNRATALKHERWHEGKTYRCQHCSEQFTKCTSYMSHVRIKHPSDSVCAQCGFSFIGERGLRMHMAKKHNLVNGTQNLNGPTCEPCKIRFASETAYEQHLLVLPKHASADELRSNDPQKAMSTYKTAVTSICELCGKQFKYAYQYRKHFKNMHRGQKPSSEAKFREICEKCGKVFKSAVRLFEHMQMHTGKKMYKCDMCGKGFMTKQYLLYHIKRHSDKLACSVCHKPFSTKANLARHMPSHLSVRPSFECEYCGKSYTSIPGLDQHVSHVHHHVPWPKKINGKRHRVNARRLSIHSD